MFSCKPAAKLWNMHLEEHLWELLLNITKREFFYFYYKQKTFHSLLSFLRITKINLIENNIAEKVQQELLPPTTFIPTNASWLGKIPGCWPRSKHLNDIYEFEKIEMAKQGSTNLIFKCTDFHAHKMVFTHICARKIMCA